MTLSIAEPHAGDRLTDQDWQVSNTTRTLPARATLTETPPGGREFRLPFVGGEFVVEIVGEPPAWVEPTIRALRELLQLGSGWDSYGAPPVNPRCVVAALNLAFSTFRDDTPLPSVVPTSRGGVQFEWHTRGVDLEIEFLSATRVRGLFEDHIEGTSWEKDLTSDLGSVAEAISTLSRGR